jgi:hypothetical protein
LGMRRYSGVWPPSKPGRTPEPARDFWPRMPNPQEAPWVTQKKNRGVGGGGSVRGKRREKRKRGDRARGAGLRTACHPLQALHPLSALGNARERDERSAHGGGEGGADHPLRVCGRRRGGWLAATLSPRHAAPLPLPPSLSLHLSGVPAQQRGRAPSAWPPGGSRAGARCCGGACGHRRRRLPRGRPSGWRPTQSPRTGRGRPGGDQPPGGLPGASQRWRRRRPDERGERRGLRA